MMQAMPAAHTHDAPISQSAFARLTNVSRQRVGQWLRDGKIDGVAIIREGDRVLIRPAIAAAQLRERLDAMQVLANGLDTMLALAPAPAAPPAPEKPAPPSIELQIKEEKLAILRAERRKVLEEERLRAGRYVLASEVMPAMVRSSARHMDFTVASNKEIAEAIALHFRLPIRDVVHFAKTKLDQIRKATASRLRAEAEALPEFIDDPDLEKALGEVSEEVKDDDAEKK